MYLSLKVKYNKLHFSGHAITQMFKRGIQVEDIEMALETGNRINEYPEDKPYPSFLLLGFVNSRPLHIVASLDEQGNCIIITAYEPETRLWSEDFTNKK
jgi:hypothetical protein